MVTSQRDAVDVPARVLRAAALNFAAAGFAGARVDEIARIAAVNKRMLYHHFGDKTGLFRAVLHGLPSPLAPDAPDSEPELLAWLERVRCAWSANEARLLLWSQLEAGAAGLGPDDPPRAMLQALAAQLASALRQVGGHGARYPAGRYGRLADHLIGALVTARAGLGSAPRLDAGADAGQADALRLLVSGLLRLGEPGRRVRLQPDLR
jgi:AcrR family transcriptional regulator